jgi:D-amino peptidase
MAKFYISADLEGVCGVTSPLQCYPKTDLTGYQFAVEQLAREVMAVVQPILQVHPEAEIVVNDAHSTMTNLCLDDLPAAVKLLSGKPKKCAMMAGLDRSFSAAFLVGYHAKAGTEGGVLNHTYHSKLYDVSINGTSYGEGGINALYAALVHEVPVILAGGDRAFCSEIKTLIPHLKTVETKVGLTTTAAQSHSVEAVLEQYQALTEKLLAESALWHSNLPKLQGPYVLEMTFTESLYCDVVMTSPLYTRADGRTVRFESDDFETLFRAMQGGYTMLNYTDFMT